MVHCISLMEVWILVVFPNPPGSMNLPEFPNSWCQHSIRVLELNSMGRGRCQVKCAYSILPGTLSLPHVFSLRLHTLWFKWSPSSTWKWTWQGFHMHRSMCFSYDAQLTLFHSFHKDGNAGEEPRATQLTCLRRGSNVCLQIPGLAF